MITGRDRKIIQHLEQYKYATIEQLEKIFFKSQANSYNIVRRRMTEIRKAGYIKEPVRDVETNKLIYLYNEKGVKAPDRHRLIVLDVLANLHHYGFSVKEYEVEKSWQGGKIRSDAFTVFTLEGVMNRYQFFVEVHLSNNYCNLDKYDKLFETGEVQRYLGRDVYPKILLVTDRKVEYYSEHCVVVELDTDLNGFINIAF